MHNFHGLPLCKKPRECILCSFRGFDFITKFISVCTINHIAHQRLSVAQKTDHRIRLMNDIICGIQIIKLYTWEKPFAQLVDLSRK
jgi:ATP-binding cassette subfamily C (CFTR/MRP) protein 4